MPTITNLILNKGIAHYTSQFAKDGVLFFNLVGVDVRYFVTRYKNYNTCQ